MKYILGIHVVSALYFEQFLQILETSLVISNWTNQDFLCTKTFYAINGM